MYLDFTQGPGQGPGLNRQSGAAAGIGDQLDLLATHAPSSRRLIHAGERLYHAVDRFDRLYIVGTGMCKTVEVSEDGREQVVAVHFKGDWMGLGGIAAGYYGCDAIAMATGEVWSVRYKELIDAGSRTPALLSALHLAMSRELLRKRASMMALCTLPADARVADFLRYWADALAERGLRTDQITLRMTRAEIGNYLGMTLESVSRALSRLARGDVIRFSEKGRRDIEIPEVGALTKFIQRSMTPAGAAVH